MLNHHWRRAIQAIIANSVRKSRPAHSRKHGTRLRLQELEDRAVPATFTVNTLVDENDGINVGNVSLREAIAAANTTLGADTIDFSVTGTINLGSELQLTETGASNITTINGTGITVSGNNAVRVLYVDSNVHATLNNLTIANGRASEGGGIYNAGTITIDNSTVSDNSADFGGGIYNTSFGTITIDGSTISGNSADVGGGLLNNGTITIDNSTVSDNSAQNSAGGIANSGTIHLNLSTITNNSADTVGGGGYNFGLGTFTINNSTVSGNSANDAGGLFNTDFGTINLTNGTTVSDNSANDGGGVYNNSGTITIDNSTVSDNSANDDGGGFTMPAVRLI
ncbi:MAG: hypothetical protein R3B84_09740 [Zavarzinella sp.]